MKTFDHACIAYLVGRLISGKTITSIYDHAQSEQIDITALPISGQLGEFQFANWSYLPGTADIGRYRYHCKSGHSLDLRVKGTTFIVSIPETSSHFIGNVKGDSVFIFDQKESAHYSYRITGKPVSH